MSGFSTLSHTSVLHPSHLLVGQFVFLYKGALSVWAEDSHWGLLSGVRRVGSRTRVDSTELEPPFPHYTYIDEWQTLNTKFPLNNWGHTRECFFRSKVSHQKWHQFSISRCIWTLSPLSQWNGLKSRLHTLQMTHEDKLISPHTAFHHIPLIIVPPFFLTDIDWFKHYGNYLTYFTGNTQTPVKTNKLAYGSV